MLGATAAFNAGVGLKADQLREVGSGDQAEVFIAGERRDLAEAAAGKKDGGGAEDQVQVLGVRNERQKDEDGQRMGPPEDAGGGVSVGNEEGGQVGGHQDEDQQGDEA